MVANVLVPEIPRSGFNFSNTMRNSKLESKGMTLPKAFKTGTTIGGLVFKDGVILGSDTRATAGSIVADKLCEKIYRLAPNIYCAGAGTAADMQHTVESVEAQLEMHRLNTGRTVPVRCAKQILQQLLFRYQGYISAYFIVGGVDFHGPYLAEIHAHGSAMVLPYTSTGSGSLAAIAMLEAAWKPDMEEEEAKKLMSDAITAGIMNDLGSGSVVNLMVIKKDSVTVLNKFNQPVSKGERSGTYRYKKGTTAVLSTNIIPIEVESSVVHHVGADTKLVPTAVDHLRWLAQKVALGQDIFLLGPPGPQKRQLATLLCSVLNREFEYVPISRDTTEADLKQRKEIQDGCTRFIDQSVIEAALNGRILIIDGIEKAERNVLPVINNLLENREMQLEDGRFLMHPVRYDELLEKYGKAKIDSLRVARVHPDFVVIGLGIPVPTFPGHPLDPPLRSRFQCRNVGAIPYKELVSQMEKISTTHTVATKQLCSWAYSMLSDEWRTLGLPHFPMGSIPLAVQLMNRIGDQDIVGIVRRLYPWTLFPVESFDLKESSSKGKKQEVHVVKKSLEKFGLNASPKSQNIVSEVNRTGANAAEVILSNQSSFHVPVGDQLLGEVNQSLSSKFVSTPSCVKLLSEMIESHSVHDICLVGPKGCGKTAIIHEFARRLGYEIEPVVMFQDMTARDLLQQRGTSSNGDTYWRISPLVSAVLNGRLAVLDGLHRVHPSTLNVIHRLVHERELQLQDGRRILRHDVYDRRKQEYSWSDEAMASKGLLRSHPSFRMIAVSETCGGPGGKTKSSIDWLNSEILSMFLFHEFPDLSFKEKMDIIWSLGAKPDDSLGKICKLSESLNRSQDPVKRSLGSSLSFRQLLRAARVLQSHPDTNPVDLVHRACLHKFLPAVAREVLDSEMLELGLISDAKQEKEITWEITQGTLRIGDVSVKVADPASIAKVPYSKFFDIKQQLATLEMMLSDFILGEHLLLIGNQGVGKNRLADRMLNLLSRPREYIQLHRDTTVSSLTVQPTVKDGIVAYEDSPLVTAVKEGHVLVVDEADKAPTQVTCILKTLVEESEMVLSDGRRIVPSHARTDDVNAIVMHPEFRMIVLANRPGFPFLGNDFFAVLGDVFSCHIIDNPDLESELSLLAQYGPNVPKHVLLPLVRAFQDLRTLADEGTLAYPYSTREAVAVVKHLQAFPEDGLIDALKNVFDFETYSKENMDAVTTVLTKHGIPIAATATSVRLGEEVKAYYGMRQVLLLNHLSLSIRHCVSRNAYSRSKLYFRKRLPDPVVYGSWSIMKDSRKLLPRQHRPIRVKGPVRVETSEGVLDRVESRVSGFTEESAYWQMPITHYDTVNDMTTFCDGSDTFVYVATSYPPSVYEMNLNSGDMNALRVRKALGTPTSGVANSKRFTLQALPLVSTNGGPLILLHDSEMNSLNLVDPRSQEVTRLLTLSTVESVADSVIRPFRMTSNPGPKFEMVPLEGTCEVTLFHPGGQSLGFVNAEQRVYTEVSVPFMLRDVFPLDEDSWMLVDEKLRKYFLTKSHSNTVAGYYLEEMMSNFRGKCLNIDKMSTAGLSDEHLSLAVKEKLSCPNSLIAAHESFADVAIGFPDLKASPNEVYRFPRPTPVESSWSGRRKSLMLVSEGMIVRAWPQSSLQNGEETNDKSSLAGWLEVVNIVNNTVKSLPVKSTSFLESGAWFGSSTPSYELWIDNVESIHGGDTPGDLVSLDNFGCLRMWQISPSSLSTSLSKWRDLVGTRVPEEMPQVTIHRSNWNPVSEPKHGKVDPNNDPHVGGNTWAGGTGGRDTAGLGGVGGPYRLDSGHNVFQVSDAEKAAVPPEVLAAARELAEKTFKKRMEEIKMNPLEIHLYQNIIDRIGPEIKKLRTIISTLQAKDKERQWVRLQTQGDLDDGRIVEGLTGEKTIYRRRAEKEPELGTPQVKPKHIRLVVDVSGSMYRFNGYDGRLGREQEAVLLMMEAFLGSSEKIRYDIYGHSGDSESVPLVKMHSPPSNPKERFDILQMMEAHSQFCLSGDNTIAAIERAAKEVNALENCDEKFVVVLSDANLERYGVSPRRLAFAIESQQDVNVTVVFVGSLGPQAERLKQSLPAGRGHVCMDTKLLPQILQQIFASSLLRMALVDYGDSDTDVSDEEGGSCVILSSAKSSPVSIVAEQRVEPVVPLPVQGSSKLKLSSLLPKPRVVGENEPAKPRNEGSDSKQAEHHSHGLFHALPKPAVIRKEDKAGIARDDVIEDFVRKVPPSQVESVLGPVKRSASGKVKISFPAISSVSQISMVGGGCMIGSLTTMSDKGGSPEILKEVRLPLKLRWGPEIQATRNPNNSSDIRDSDA
ncbi:unnamed protein product [Notodromas monacha]|uniref:von Willebrand factor A domain-containing protein 8 n=1 Tax=Notodromas monacha TaxID=399045 RepID=A0A7R9BRQ6_9CRUS|nr:unnamed protein product [Notodromas monacha]CAG0920479.1 unnamed protein product [Notodromas monacha]